MPPFASLSLSSATARAAHLWDGSCRFSGTASSTWSGSEGIGLPFRDEWPAEMSACSSSCLMSRKLSLGRAKIRTVVLPFLNRRVRCFDVTSSEPLDCARLELLEMHGSGAGTYIFCRAHREGGKLLISEQRMVASVRQGRRGPVRDWRVVRLKRAAAGFGFGILST